MVHIEGLVARLAMSWVLCLPIFVCLLFSPVNSAHQVPFRSFKAPSETIINYEIVWPDISWSPSREDSTRNLVVHIGSDSVNFTIHLEQNVGLLSPKFTSRYHGEDGTEIVQKGHDNCFYHGTIAEQPSWRASFSTCFGLRGSFGPLHDHSEHYHLEPLSSNTRFTEPHVLYLGSEYSQRQGVCGTKKDNTQIHETHSHYSSDVNQRVRRQSPVHLVEWTLVNDNAQFLRLSNNLTAVVLRSVEIANGVDLLYREIGVRVAVVDVITWTMFNPIEVVDDPDILLTSFVEVAPSLPQKYDSIMLFVGEPFSGSTIGLAYTGTMCNIRLSLGLVEDAGRDLDHVISTTAHELGHIFNMDHDNSTCGCNDPSGSCIMSAILGYPAPASWSSCSISTLQASVSGYLSRCLGNEPLLSVTNPSCGNGIQEEGEACDCGTVEECVDPCCNATSCDLVPGTQCRAGECCQPDCQFKPRSAKCRNASNVCDIAEYCTGNSDDCPKDLYLQDLSFCNGNESYCFYGVCNNRDIQCMEHFGTESEVDDCYTIHNTRGFIGGHCGHNQTAYIPCAERNAFCGQVQCGFGNLLTNIGFVRNQQLFVEGDLHDCTSVTTLAGSDEVSPGLARDGTPCGTDMICLHTQCVSTSVVDIVPCPVGRNGETCAGQGVCNNENECSCFNDFSGKACDASASQASNAGEIAGAVIGVLFGLGIIGAVVALVVFFIWRSRSAKYIAKSYIPRTTGKGAGNQRGGHTGPSAVRFTRDSQSSNMHNSSRNGTPKAPPKPSRVVHPARPQHPPPHALNKASPTPGRPPPPHTGSPQTSHLPPRPPRPTATPPVSGSRPSKPPPPKRPPPSAPVHPPPPAPSAALQPPVKPGPKPKPRNKLDTQWPPSTNA